MSDESGAQANAGQAAPAAPDGNAGTTPTDWTANLSDEYKAIVSKKGWKDANAALESYRNLESVMGAQEEQILRIPKADDKAAWDKLHYKLGRPAEPDGYELQTPEGGDAELTKKMAGWFHKAGVTKSAAKEITDAINAEVAAQAKAVEQAAAEQRDTELAELKKQWGLAYDRNLQVARKACAEFGVTEEQLAALQESTGFAGVMSLFQNIGSRLGEDSLVSSGTPSGFSAPMEPGVAKAQIEALMTDREFTTRMMEGDVKARDEWNRLHKYAYPNPQ